MACRLPFLSRTSCGRRLHTQAAPKPHLLLFGAMEMKPRVLEKYLDVYDGCFIGKSVIPLSYADVFSTKLRRRFYERTAEDLEACTSVHAHVLSGGCLHFASFAEKHPDVAGKIRSVVLDSPCQASGVRESALHHSPHWLRPIVASTMNLAFSFPTASLAEAISISDAFEQKPPPTVGLFQVLVLRGSLDFISSTESIERLAISWEQAGCKVETSAFQDCGHVDILRKHPALYKQLCQAAVVTKESNSPKTRSQ
jgi:hypothetical protein